MHGGRVRLQPCGGAHSFGLGPFLAASARPGRVDTRGRAALPAPASARRAIVPIGACYAITLWVGNAAYLYLSVSFIQMLKVSKLPGRAALGSCLASRRCCPLAAEAHQPCVQSWQPGLQCLCRDQQAIHRLHAPPCASPRRRSCRWRCSLWACCLAPTSTTPGPLPTWCL